MLRTSENLRTISKNGVVVQKYFLHHSKIEQKRRFLERIEIPETNWRVAVSDAVARALDEYMEAYEDKSPQHRDG